MPSPAGGLFFLFLRERSTAEGRRVRVYGLASTAPASRRFILIVP
jgi:hypothetical protein